MNRPADAADPTSERLVAYLDGELPPHDSERLEREIATDGALRQRVSGLDRVWSALDAAPRATTDPVFTDSTVAVVVAEAQREAERRTAALPRVRRRRWWGFAAAGIAAAAVGFVLVRAVSTTPERRMFFELPTIRYAAALSQATSVDYLRRVAEAAPAAIAAVDSADVADDAAEWGSIAQTPPPRRAEWFDRQPPETQDELLEQTLAFRALPAARADRLRGVREAIDGADDAAVLRRTALAHHALLSVLPSGERAAFLSMPEEDRIRRLRREGGRWAQEAAFRLDDAERREFADAVERVAQSESMREFVDRVTSRFDADRRRPPTRDAAERAANRFRDRVRRGVADRAERFRDDPGQVVLRVAWFVADDRRRRAGFASLPPELRERWSEWEAGLTDGLPERARRVLSAEDSTRRRAWLLATTIEDAVVRSRSGGLAEFFAAELDADEQRRLLAMPVTEMQDELRRRMVGESFGEGRAAPVFDPRAPRGEPGLRPPAGPPPRGPGRGFGPPPRRPGDALRDARL